MKVTSYEFTDKWSWGLVMKDIAASFGNIVLERKFKSYINRIDQGDSDIVVLQNATMLDIAGNARPEKKIIRLGGNRTFMGNEDRYAQDMAKCFAVIATNRHLYEIAVRHNPNTHIVYNGLDLNKWKPNAVRTFRAGFCGNISKPSYLTYKGYDILQDAIILLAGEGIKIELADALYGDGQIEHARMMPDFYYKIDCLVHPTAGEGCSNTVMEACACGVPIVTTREAGMHGELMQDGVDCLFVERTSESIAAALKKLYFDRHLLSTLSQGARAFAERYHDINVISAQYVQIFKDCVKANMPKPLIGYGITSQHKDWAHGSTVDAIMEKLKKDFDFEDLSKTFGTSKYDAVWFRGGPMSDIPAGVPFVWTCGTGGAFLKGFADAHDHPKAACVIVQNREAKKFLRSRGNRKPIFVIPNGVDTDMFNCDRTLAVDPDDFVVGFAARKNNGHKGWEFFKTSCDLAGIRSVKVCGYEANERIPHSQMPEFYNSIDCLVQVSDAEGCSNSIMEAMSCGVPCIIHRKSGYHGDVCENCKEVIFAERTAEDIADKITMLRNNADLHRRISANARTFALRHSWDIISHKYARVFNFLAMQKTNIVPIVKECSKVEPAPALPIIPHAPAIAKNVSPNVPPDHVRVMFREDVFISGRQYYKEHIEVIRKKNLAPLGSKIKILK